MSWAVVAGLAARTALVLAHRTSKASALTIGLAGVTRVARSTLTVAPLCRGGGSGGRLWWARLAVRGLQVGGPMSCVP